MPVRGFAVLAAVLVAYGVSGCSGGDDAKKSSTYTSSSSASPSSSGVSADALAKEILAQGRTVQAPRQTVTVPGTNGRTTTVGVRSLVVTGDQTILTLVATSDDTGIPSFYSAEDLAAWRDLHPLSVEDPVGKVRYYPYRYVSLPGKPGKGSTSPDEPGLTKGVWQQWGAIILPPLPASATSVTLNIPRGISDSKGLASDPIATIKDVPVTRS